MKSTYDKVAAEAFAGDPTPRDEMEPWQRISILIQSGMNYAMAAEIERGVTIKQSQVAEGVAHALSSIIYLIHANAIDYIDKEAADRTVQYIHAHVIMAVTQCLNNAAPETLVTGTTVTIKPPN